MENSYKNGVEEGHSSNKKGPIFVMGFPRSGTTIMGNALCSLQGISGCSGGNEGHWMYLFSELLTKVQRPNCLNQASILARNDNMALLERHLSQAFDRFWREIAGDGNRWVDKTPDLRQVKAALTLQKWFGEATIIFMYRSPLKVIRSNLETWPHIRFQVEKVAERWVEVMSEWRNQRELLKVGSYIEVFQNTLRQDANKVCSCVAETVELSEEQTAALADFIQNRKVNTSPKKKKSMIPLSASEIEAIRSITQAEAELWPEIISET